MKTKSQKTENGGLRIRKMADGWVVADQAGMPLIHCRSKAQAQRLVRA